MRERRTKQKKSGVTNIDSPAGDAAIEPRLIASDPVTQRMIISLGSQRIAFDRTIRITRLDPEVGDKPAPVVPMKGPDTRKLARGK